MNLLALSALAGAGKDTVADHLVAKYGYVKMALADPLKRIARDLYGFSEAQLWGPSALRNAPDVRFIRETHERHSWVENTKAEKEGDRWVCDRCEFPQSVLAYRERVSRECIVYLSPRTALQLIGTNGVRAAYEDTWVDLGIRIAKQIISGGYRYSGPTGIVQDPSSSPKGVVLTDCRFLNEVSAFRKNGARTVRIIRDIAGLSGAAASHPSERELSEAPAGTFDHYLLNNGSLAALHERVDELVSSWA